MTVKIVLSHKIGDDIYESDSFISDRNRHQRSRAKEPRVDDKSSLGDR